MDTNVTQAMKEFSIAVYGNLEKYNEVLSKARCRIFYKYGNRNGTYITDEFAEKLVSSLPYAPVKGIYDGEGFTDHGGSRSLGRIYGIVPENPNFAWETHEDEDGVQREYACVDVLLYTALYEEAKDIKDCAQSMELYDKAIKGDWQFVDGKKYFVFTDGCFLGLQVLGEDVQPCFEGAAFYTVYESIMHMLNKIEQFNLNSQETQQGGNEMPSINFKLSDDQKFDMLWNLLNPSYNKDGGWVVDCSICSVYDEYAVVRNYGEQCFERVYYKKNDSTDSLELGERKRCFIVDVTEDEKLALETLQKLNGGNYTKVDENYTSGKEAIEQNSELQLKIEEYNTSVSTLTTERDEAISKYEDANSLLQEAQNALTDAQNNLSSLQTQNDELVSYKKGVEKKEKEAIIDSYKDLLSPESLERYRSQLEEFTAIDLDKELAYELKTKNPSVFTKGNDPQWIPKEQEPTGIEAILSHYVK